MKKTQISYEIKYDLIRAYIEGDLPENEFDYLCERVKSFKHQYKVQKKNYEIVKKTLEPVRSPENTKSTMSLIFHNISEVIETFPEFISEATKDIQQIFTPVEFRVEYARSADKKSDEIRKELQFKTIEDISNSISGLTGIFYTKKDVRKIELKFEFAEKEKYLEIDKRESPKEVNKKVIKIIERFGFDKLDRINVFII